MEELEHEDMTLKEFIDNVNFGAYNDEDGVAWLYNATQARGSYKYEVPLLPSELENLRIKWYNK